MHNGQSPARFLVVIDAAGEMLALMFDRDRHRMADFDASSSEVAVMTQGLRPEQSASGPEWDTALSGHSRKERQQAQVYSLDV